jgi:hypothetical protein
MFAQRWSRSRRHGVKNNPKPLAGEDVARALWGPRTMGWCGSCANIKEWPPLWAGAWAAVFQMAWPNSTALIVSKDAGLPRG